MGLKFNNQFIPTYGNKEDEITDTGDAGIVNEQSVVADSKDKKQSSIKILSFFKDERVKGVAGIGCLLFAALLLLSSISYFVNGAADQSLVDANGIIENARNSGIRNDGGPFGASIADLLFNRGFGVGAFFLIYLIAVIGLHLIGKYRLRMSSTIVICLVATVTVSSVVGLVTLYGGSFFPLGGEHGKYLNEFMISVAGIYGAIFFNIFLISILVALCINSLKRIYRGYCEFVEKRRAVQMEAKRREEEEARHTFGGKVMAAAAPKPVSERIRVEDIQFGGQDSDEEFAQDNDVGDDAADIVPESSGIKAEDVEETPSESEDVTLKPIEKADSVMEKPFDPTAELSRFKFPPSTLLHEAKNNTISVDIQEQEENKARITKTLGDYGIEIKSIKVSVGPTVTLYEIIPAEGVRISKIKVLEDDIALSLAALGIRIIAPIPGKGTIGIEVPNKEKQTVSMRSIIESKKFQECNYKLPIAMGCTISNDVFIADLAKMPHILVAGATGMGKSVGLNAIITSLLYKKHPSELKFVMIDPKMVEFSMYAPLEYHYIAQMEGEEDAIITNMNKAVATLNSLVQEMEDRLLLLNDAHERNIEDYNKKFVARRLNPEKGHKFLPYIVVVIDELADLIMNIGRKEVEMPIARITQKARAVGIHMILATQRPSTDIITGVIKANCPGRIAFRVTQMVDSRTILDRSGAQQLIGRGDMLITYDNQLTRVQCAFVDTPEVEAIVDYISNQVGFDHPYELPKFVPEQAEGGSGNGGGFGSFTDRDPLFDEAAEFVVSSGNTASTSSLQRRYSIGYNRAGKLMDQMEAAGIVGPAVGGKPRQVLVDAYGLENILNQNK